MEQAAPEKVRAERYEIDVRFEPERGFLHAKATVTLRDQVAAMTLEAVERILQQKLDAKTDQHLVETVLAELEGKGAPR